MQQNTIVKIKDELNESLELNSSASKFLNGINQLKEENISIDFEGIIFICRSFA